MGDSAKQSTVLYICFGEFSNNYFESEEKCNEYYQKSTDPFAKVGVIEYFSYFEGKDDVIKLTVNDEEEYIVSICDEVSYYTYKSNENNSDTSHWEKVTGTAEWMYAVFRDKGIIFKNDIYAEAKKEEKQLVKALTKASHNVNLSINLINKDNNI